MFNKKKRISFIIALVFAISLFLNNIAGLSINVKAETIATTQVNAINDGAILHAWNWSFNTIKAKLPEIKAAGYTAVQTSPIQGNKEDLMANSKWWVLYQPTNFKIGNAQLGSRDEFKSMCDEAEKYGIDVIVDVVANHTGNRGSGTEAYYPANNVDSDIKDNANFWHEHRGVEDWNNRWQVTQWGIGLPDLNTANWDLQNKVIAFLNDAVACGADGFRFDAAKHIELPSDPGGSDFWPRVLGALNNKDNLFIYGEVLQGGADNINAYHQYMKTTTDWYGGSIRSAVGYNATANVNNAKNYTVSGSATNLVTWVESHDTYANDHKETVGLTNEQIKLGWALIAGRAGSTPLYFNRTAGGYLAGNMGNAGDDMWKDPIVVAANTFRNNMAGEGEYIRTQGNNVFITERGTKGVMIVNVGDSTSVNSDTNLPSGEYTDSVSGAKFTVSNGKLTGNIGSRTIATIVATPIVAKPEVGSSVVTNTKFVDSINVTLSAKNTTSANYSINGGAVTTYTNGTVLPLGKEAKVGDKITLTLSGTGEGGATTSATYVYEKVDKITNAVAKIKIPSGWSDPKIYVYDESVTPTKVVSAWPGVSMTKESEGVYTYTLPDGWGDNTKVIFNSGSNQIPAAQQPGLSLKTGEKRIYQDGAWSLVTVSDPVVSSSVVDGSTFTNSLNVTLSASNTTKATYSIDGGNVTTYTNGQLITLGANTAVGSTVKLTLVGENSEGKTVTKTYNYTKTPVVQNGVAKIKVPTGWGVPNVYVYDESVTPVKKIAAWPGVAMTKESEGVYTYTLPDGWGEKTQVIFNSGSNQIPASQQPGFYLKPGEIRIYQDGSWNLVTVQDPVVSSSANDGATFTNSLSVTLSASNTTKATYSINGGTATAYTNGQLITVGAEASVGDIVKLTLVGENSSGKIVTQSYNYTKIAKIDNGVAKIKLPSGWSVPNIYVYDESGTTVKEVAKWPGVAMTKESEGVYTYTIPDGWGEKTQIIFNSGSNQIPAAKQPGYYLKPGETGIYADGQWTVTVNQPLAITSFTSDLLSPQVEGTTMKLTSNATGGSGQLNYEFSYKKDGATTATVIKNYSTDNTASWTPAVSGSYELIVSVKDGKGAVLTKSFNYTINKKVVDVVISSVSLDKQTIKVGDSVNITTVATGNGTLQYRVSAHDYENTWTTLQELNGSNITAWQPQVADRYVIWVDVIDELGKYSSKSIEVTVTP